MPLTHVSVWDAEVGYRRVTKEEASIMYPYSGVPAEKKHFVCELCAQGACFTAPGIYDRHFRHDSAAQNKDCEDRQKRYDSPIAALNEHAMPIRIQVTGDTFNLQLGFFYPHKVSEQDVYCEKIRIATDNTSFEYEFDRISGTGITYLNVGSRPSQVYKVEYARPSDAVKKFWPTTISGIGPKGALFEKRSGKLLHAGSNAYAGEIYYFLTKNRVAYKSPVGYPDINAKEIASVEVSTYIAEKWYLYEISSKCFSKNAAQFFLERSVFLREDPLKFYPIWPVYVADSYFIYHEEERVFFYMAGTNADLNSFPIPPEPLAPREELVDGGKIVRIYAPSKEQLLALGASGALGFSYLLRQSLDMSYEARPVTIEDLDGNKLEQDHCTKIPKAKGIIISSDVDGRVLLYQKGRLQRVYPLAGEGKVTVEPVSLGMEIRIYQGCDLVRTLVFQKAEVSNDISAVDKDLAAKLNACYGDVISVSHSLGSVVEKLRNYPKTKRWLYITLRRGIISRKALQLLKSIL